MMKPLRLSVFVLASASLSTLGHAVIFDDFSQGTDTLMMTTGTGTLTQIETGLAILGGERVSTLGVTSNPFSQPVSLDIPAGRNGGSSTNGAFYSSGVQVQGYAQFDYQGLHIDGQQGPGLNANLSNDGSFMINMLATDTPVRVDVTATTFGSTNNVSVGSFTTAGSINTPTTYQLNFSDMTIASGSPSRFNSSNLSELTIRFTPLNPGGDFAISSIRTAPVPEPASLAALFVGGLGLIRMRRRTRVRG